MFRKISAVALLILAVSLVVLAWQGRELAPETDETVFFRGWQYKTDIVQDNVNRYNTELGGHVDYATVTGDYPALMETKLMAKAPLDILYANPSQACRYFDGGWLIPAEQLPDIEAIKADMYPNVLEAWTYKGQLLGLSYFVTTRGVIHVNKQKFEELGYSEADYPATWDELYDMLYELRDKGVQHPFLPHWFGEWYGISWAFVFEVMNRGGQVADPETHAPLVTVDGPAGETLRDWKRIWNDGLVPREVLSYKEPDYLQAWGSGEYIFSPQQAYDLKKFNDPMYCTFAGYDDFIPYKGQSWGLIDSAMYLMSSRPRSEGHTRDVMRFLEWYGWRDHEGELFVAQRWMETSMLFSAYKPVMESAVTEEVIRSSLCDPEDYTALIELYSKTPYPRGVFNVVWAPEFNSWLKETLQNFLLKDRPVAETIQAIVDKISELNDRYGVGG